MRRHRHSPATCQPSATHNKLSLHRRLPLQRRLTQRNTWTEYLPSKAHLARLSRPLPQVFPRHQQDPRAAGPGGGAAHILEPGRLRNVTGRTRRGADHRRYESAASFAAMHLPASMCYYDDCAVWMHCYAAALRLGRSRNVVGGTRRGAHHCRYGTHHTCVVCNNGMIVNNRARPLFVCISLHNCYLCVEAAALALGIWRAGGRFLASGRLLLKITLHPSRNVYAGYI